MAASLRSLNTVVQCNDNQTVINNTTIAVEIKIMLTAANPGAYYKAYASRNKEKKLPVFFIFFDLKMQLQFVKLRKK